MSDNAKILARAGQPNDGPSDVDRVIRRVKIVAKRVVAVEPRVDNAEQRILELESRLARAEERITKLESQQQPSARRLLLTG